MQLNIWTDIYFYLFIFGLLQRKFIQSKNFWGVNTEYTCILKLMHSVILHFIKIMDINTDTECLFARKKKSNCPKNTSYTPFMLRS